MFARVVRNSVAGAQDQLRRLVTLFSAARRLKSDLERVACGVSDGRLAAQSNNNPTRNKLKGVEGRREGPSSQSDIEEGREKKEKKKQSRLNLDFRAACEKEKKKHTLILRNAKIRRMEERGMGQ